MKFVNIHFENKHLILQELLNGPRCVMVLDLEAAPEGSVASLKTTYANNKKRLNRIHR